MKKAGRVWAVLLESKKYPVYRYICEDNSGELWQFYIQKKTHKEIEEDQGNIIGKHVMWDFNRGVLSFFR